jgi:4'-phosphopantetheinyl transferase
MESPLPTHRTEPPGLTRLAPGEVHVWVARLEGAADLPRLAGYRNWLDEPEQRRLDRLATAALKAEFLLTRALCRETLSRYADVAPPDWRFELNAYGKPSIAAPAVPLALKFNLSNARTIVACAVTVDAEVGIDIEPWKQPQDALPISPQVFSAAELRALRDCDPGERSRRFHELWTLKEACVKACGQGLSMDPALIAIDPRAVPIRATSVPPMAYDAARWHFEQLDVGPDHLLAVAVAGSEPGKPRVALRQVDLRGFD